MKKRLSKTEIGVLIAEALILLICIMGLFGKTERLEFAGADFETVADEENGNTVYRGPESSLKPGVYRVSLEYETGQDMTNVWSVQADQISFDGLKANTCMLYSGLTETDMYIWLTESTETLRVEVTQVPEGQVIVHGAALHQTNMGSRMALICFLALFLLIDLLYVYRGRINKKRWFWLLLITAFASMPLLTGYEIAGADTIYHLLRIEGIKDGLLSGQFPVRIQPNWLQGYGYATGIFYCDTFLYIPAFFRIMGFPVGTAYLAYKFMVNIGTVWIAWFSFSKIFKDERIGMFASALYSLNIYRLLCMYLKDHLGQYTAMMFLPLLAYSIWRLLSEDIKSPSYRKIWIPLTISVTGIIQCHVLTCELAGIFGALVCLIFWKRTFRKSTLLEIGKMAAASCVLSLWFIVPFVDYMATQNLIITGDAVFTRSIQGYGAVAAQLLGMFSFVGHADMDVSSGIQGEIPFTVGAPLLIGFGFLIYFYMLQSAKGKENSAGNKAGYKGEKEHYHVLGITAIVFAVLSLFMASVFFPWDRIQNMGGLACRLVSALQYPTRLLEIAAVFLTLGCGAAWKKSSGVNRKIYVGTTAAVLVITVSMFMTELLTSSGFYTIYEEDAMGNAYLSGREYLPEGTDESLLKADSYAVSDGLKLEQVEKEHLQVTVTCQNTDTQGYVDLPLLYYRGYQVISASAADAATFTVAEGDNHVVRIQIPASYQGTFTVDYVSPVYWRLAEIISILGWLLIIGYALLSGYKKYRRVE